MKKILLLLFTFVCFSANAQQRIIGANNVTTILAGEAIPNWSLVRITAGKVWKANSTKIDSAAVAIAIDTAFAANDTIQIAYGGILQGFALSKGADYFLGTGGAFTATKPTSIFTQKIGTWVEDSTLQLNIQQALPIIKIEAGEGISVSTTNNTSTITNTGGGGGGGGISDTTIILNTAVTEIAITVPTWAKMATTYVVGGGGGAGSGRQGLAGSVRCGGGGGGGGALSFGTFSLSALGNPTTFFARVGIGGTGGAAQSTVSTNGLAGAGGGSSFIGTTSGVANIFISAIGGGAGAGGTASSGSAGPAGTTGMFAGGAGAAASASGLGGSSAAAVTTIAASGGGSGAGISTANASAAGGNGGSCNAGQQVGGIGGAAGSNDGLPSASTGFSYARPGAGGGGSNASGAAGRGGDATQGGGGGGGAGSLNGFASGRGGNGGAGYIVIIFSK